MPDSEAELIRFGQDIERLSATIDQPDAGGIAGIEFAYLRDRVAAIPASGLAGAAIKLRGFIAGLERGSRPDETDMTLLANVLQVVETAAKGVWSGGVTDAMEAEAAQPRSSAEPSFELTVEGLVSRLAAVAAQHRALIGRNLELRARAESSLSKTQALRASLDELTIALGDDAVDHPLLEPKFLALFSYWERCRGECTMPRRSDIDPLDLTDLWPDLGLWSWEGGDDFRCRLCGTQVSSLIEADPSGKLLSQIDHPFWNQERAVLGAVARAGRPALSTREVNGKGLALKHRSLTLPLSNDGRAVDMLLTATTFRNPKGQIEKPYFTRARATAQRR